MKISSLDWKTTQGLDFSGIAQYGRCGEQFRRVRLGDKQPPSFALIEGTSTHLACQQNNIHKRAKGTECKPQHLIDVSMQKFEEETSKPEAKQTFKKAEIEKEKDEVIKRAKVWFPEYLTKYAPAIKPEWVEQPVHKEVEVEGTKFTLSGVIDLTTAKQVVDYKTASAVLSQGEADSSLQLSLYSMFSGKMDVGITCFVKTKNPYVAWIPSRRTPAHYQWALKVAKSAVEAIRLGAFPLAVPSSQSWWCTEKFCGFWATCRGQFETVGAQKLK
jgi:hypothetical protein